MKKTSILFVCMIALVAFVTWVPDADSRESYFTSTPGQNLSCADCHVSASVTCAGCHAHGVHSSNAKNDINVIAITDFLTYAPGETVTVSISGGSRDGWVRTILYDETGAEVNRSTGPTGDGDGPQFFGPIDLTAPAPTAPGTYTWTASWYGNEFDLTEVGGTTIFGPNWRPDTTNPGHGEEIVETNSFEVVAGNTAPVAVDDPVNTTPVNTSIDIDVLDNDTDADGDTLTVNDDFDTASAKGGTVSCDTAATTPTPQCTYDPAIDVCGEDTFTYAAFDGTDPSANRATVTITVGDANAPLVTAPTPDPLIITVAAGTTSVPATDPAIAAWLASATANDADEGPLGVSNNAPDNFPRGDTPVTFTATDSCGNVGSATATVRVVDAENNIPQVAAPTPDPLLVTAPLCATSVPQSATADNFAGTIVEWLATATAEDLEDGVLSVINNAPASFPLNDTLVTFSATDSLGATGTAIATVRVAEAVNTAPVVTPPTPDPLIITVAAGTTSVPATDPTIAAWLASATANDAEEGELLVNNNAPADFPLGTTTVTFTATDACGLPGTATAQVTIQEEAGNIAPVVTVPDPITVTAELCADSVPATDLQIATWLDSALADDAEDGPLLVSNDALANFPAAMAPGATTTVNFSATDSGGLTTTVPSPATVIDPNTAPVVTAPAPLTLTVPQGTTSMPATDPAIAAFLASATANDAEDGSLGVSNDAPADFPLGTTTVTFSATDSCGVIGTAQSTMTIQEEVLVVIDLDIAQFQVTKRVRLAKVKPVKIKLVVRNNGMVNSQTRDATVIGMQVQDNVAVEVYNETLEVSDAVGDGRSTFKFPPYTPGSAGDIMWTATIADDDPDIDEATAVTIVK